MQFLGNLAEDEAKNNCTYIRSSALCLSLASKPNDWGVLQKDTHAVVQKLLTEILLVSWNVETKCGRDSQATEEDTIWC